MLFRSPLEEKFHTIAGTSTTGPELYPSTPLSIYLKSTLDLPEPADRPCSPRDKSSAIFTHFPTRHKLQTVNQLNKAGTDIRTFGLSSDEQWEEIDRRTIPILVERAESWLDGLVLWEERSASLYVLKGDSGVVEPIVMLPAGQRVVCLSGSWPYLLIISKVAGSAFAEATVFVEKESDSLQTKLVQLYTVKVNPKTKRGKLEFRRIGPLEQPHPFLRLEIEGEYSQSLETTSLLPISVCAPPPPIFLRTHTASPHVNFPVLLKPGIPSRQQLTHPQFVYSDGYKIYNPSGSVAYSIGNQNRISSLDWIDRGNCLRISTLKGDVLLASSGRDGLTTELSSSPGINFYLEDTGCKTSALVKGDSWTDYIEFVMFGRFKKRVRVRLPHVPNTHLAVTRDEIVRWDASTPCMWMQVFRVIEGDSDKNSDNQGLANLVASQAFSNERVSYNYHRASDDGRYHLFFGNKGYSVVDTLQKSVVARTESTLLHPCEFGEQSFLFSFESPEKDNLYLAVQCLLTLEAYVLVLPEGYRVDLCRLHNLPTKCPFAFTSRLLCVLDKKAKRVSLFNLKFKGFCADIYLPTRNISSIYGYLSDRIEVESEVETETGERVVWRARYDLSELIFFHPVNLAMSADELLQTYSLLPSWQLMRLPFIQAMAEAAGRKLVSKLPQLERPKSLLSPCSQFLPSKYPYLPLYLPDHQASELYKREDLFFLKGELAVHGTLDSPFQSEGVVVKDEPNLWHSQEGREKLKEELMFKLFFDNHLSKDKDSGKYYCVFRGRTDVVPPPTAPPEVKSLHLLYTERGGISQSILLQAFAVMLLWIYFMSTCIEFYRLIALYLGVAITVVYMPVRERRWLEQRTVGDWELLFSYFGVFSTIIRTLVAMNTYPDESTTDNKLTFWNMISRLIFFQSFVGATITFISRDMKIIYPNLLLIRKRMRKYIFDPLKHRLKMKLISLFPPFLQKKLLQSPHVFPKAVSSPLLFILPYIGSTTLTPCVDTSMNPEWEYRVRDIKSALQGREVKIEKSLTNLDTSIRAVEGEVDEAIEAVEQRINRLREKIRRAELLEN